MRNMLKVILAIQFMWVAKSETITIFEDAMDSGYNTGWNYSDNDANGTATWNDTYFGYYNDNDTGTMYLQRSILTGGLYHSLSVQYYIRYGYLCSNDEADKLWFRYKCGLSSWQYPISYTSSEMSRNGREGVVPLSTSLCDYDSTIVIGFYYEFEATILGCSHDYWEVNNIYLFGEYDPPTSTPTAAPTAFPTNHPTENPSLYPSNVPSNAPTAHPSVAPTEDVSDGIEWWIKMKMRLLSNAIDVSNKTNTDRLVTIVVNVIIHKYNNEYSVILVVDSDISVNITDAEEIPIYEQSYDLEMLILCGSEDIYDNLWRLLSDNDVIADLGSVIEYQNSVEFDDNTVSVEITEVERMNSDPSPNNGNSSISVILIVILTVVITTIVIICLIGIGFLIYRKRQTDTGKDEVAQVQIAMKELPIKAEGKGLFVTGQPIVSPSQDIVTASADNGMKPWPTTDSLL